MSEINQDFIEVSLGEITESQVESFRAATRANLSQIPLTFATRFRDAEYQWLDRLKVDMRHLLHADQEYVFHRALKVGDSISLKSWLSDRKERQRTGLKMQFFKLETEIRVGSEIVISTATTFVVKTPTPKTEGGGA